MVVPLPRVATQQWNGSVAPFGRGCLRSQTTLPSLDVEQLCLRKSALLQAQTVTLNPTVSCGWATSMPSSPDYRVRRGEISAYGRALASSKQLRLLCTYIAIGFTTLLVLLVFLTLWSVPRGTFLIGTVVLVAALVLALIVFTVISLWSVYQYTNQHFIEPDLAFRMWLQQVCDGDLDARIGLDKNHRHYKELNFHTTNLATSLLRLSDNMDSLVESQTKKLSEQKRVLELLFKLTSDVSNESEDEAAYETVCKYLAEWFESARVSCYEVVPGEGKLRCVATSSVGDIANAASTNSTDGSVFADVVTLDHIPQQISTIEPTGTTELSEVWVPFFAGDQKAGVLIVERQSLEQTEHSETRRVLTTVSEQLSLLCSKHRVQKQVLNARLSRDRNELAAEIHDSLAQTLLAIRYQTTLLSEKLKSQNDASTYHDVLKITGSIEEANEEVRGLIREYRSPLAEHRYADSLQVVIDQFSKASGVSVFFQSDDPQIRFTPREESALQRIIGEALNNARKYADASMVRVYLKIKSSGVRSILIEDDGVGFDQSVANDAVINQPSDSGEQIGLTIMQERALSIGARLNIDSERGEGTRVLISMPPLIEPQRDSA